LSPTEAADAKAPAGDAVTSAPMDAANEAPPVVSVATKRAAANVSLAMM
jgi:hypothetical protein